MIENFKHRYSDSFEDTLNIGQLISEGNLTNEETLFLKRVKEAWTAAGNKAADLKEIAVYVKPEEEAIYYVVNGDVTGKVEF